MKKALVLAGGIAQAALIDELRARGYYTLLADMNPECYAAERADEFCPVSAMDLDALEKLALEQRVDMIVTACADQILLAEAYLCEKLGLRSYISYATAKLVSDKKYMKDIFLKNGVPTSRYVILDKFSKSRIRSLKYPLIVKPVDAYSSKGVRRCNDAAEVKEYLEQAIRISRTKTAVVEEYVEGQELTVEFFVRDGKARMLCCGKKEKLKDGNFVGYGSLYSAELPEKLKQNIETVGQKVAGAFGLVNSPMLIQMITDGENVFVLEFCARTGGFIKYEIVRRMSGVDPIGLAVDLHEGTIPSIDGIRPEKKYLLSCFLYCSDGVLDRYRGFEEIVTAGIATKYWLVRKPGYKFKTIESSGDRAACFIIQDDSYEELLSKYRKAMDTVKVLDKDGRDLIRFDLM